MTLLLVGFIGKNKGKWNTKILERINNKMINQIWITQT